MRKPYATGLVVGKFAPLHQGHRFLIERARELCEHVVLISYCTPEFDRFPPELREQWLAACCPDTTRLVVTDAALEKAYPVAHPARRAPHNDAPDDVHRHFVADLCIDVLHRRIDAVFSSEAYGPGFAAVLTQRFAAAGLGTAPVAHVEVDRNRQTIPISGTALRSNLWQHWQYLPKPVATTLVQRVVFLGGESTGKSTLAAQLARDLDTACAPEYGRELWNLKQGDFIFPDMLAIAREQISREERAGPTARAFLFCDTSPLTTLFYSQELFGHADPELHAAANRAYDYTFLCAPDFPHQQDGTRREPEFALRQHDWYQTELNARGVPFLILRGAPEARARTVRAALGL